jgi:hypothetical protein
MSLNRIISFWGIGSGGNPDVRYTQFIESKRGWRGFVNRADFQDQLNAGVCRFVLHSPFGREKDVRWQTVNGEKYDTIYRFDAYQAALQSKLVWLTNGFAEAIKPIVDQGCQVIVYLGSLAGALEYELVSGSERRKWLEGCLKPFKEAGCDYAIDTACRAPLGHYCNDIAEEMRGAGRRVYCESMPRAEADQWCLGDVMSSEEQYQAALNDKTHQALCDPKRIVGELVRGMWQPAPPPYKNYVDYYQAVVPKALADGHSVCLQVRHFLAQGGKLEGLIA